MPVDVLLGRERTPACQVVKQADVVQLVALLWGAVPPARAAPLLPLLRAAHRPRELAQPRRPRARRRPARPPRARPLRYLDQTADIDLGNTMGNAAGGVHAAALGSLWQAVVLGVGGVRPTPDDAEGITIEPHLVPAGSGTSASRSRGGDGTSTWTSTPARSR